MTKLTNIIGFEGSDLPWANLSDSAKYRLPSRPGPQMLPVAYLESLFLMHRVHIVHFCYDAIRSCCRVVQCRFCALPHLQLHMGSMEFITDGHQNNATEGT